MNRRRVYVLISRAHGCLTLLSPLPFPSWGRFWRSAIFVVRMWRSSGWPTCCGLGILFRLENSRYTRSISPRRSSICGTSRSFLPLLIRLVDVESPLGGNWKWEMSTLDDLEFFFFLIRSSCGKLERYISLFYFFFSRNVIKIRNLNIFKLFVIVTRLLKTSSGFRLGWLLVNCEKLNHFQFNALVFEVKMRRKYCNFIAVVYCSYLRIFLLTISAFIYKETCLDFV